MALPLPGQKLPNIAVAEFTFRQPTSFDFLRKERWPHVVYYIAGKATYVSPDYFFIGRAPQGSDSVWIVPGTTP